MSGGETGWSAGTTYPYMCQDRAVGGPVTAHSGFTSNATPRMAIVRDKEGRDGPKLLNLYLDSGDTSSGFGSITARVIQPKEFKLEWLDEKPEMAQLSAEDTTGLVGWSCKHSTSADLCKFTFTEEGDDLEKTMTLFIPQDSFISAPANTTDFFEVGLTCNGSQAYSRRLLKFGAMPRRQTTSGEAVNKYVSA